MKFIPVENLFIGEIKKIIKFEREFGNEQSFLVPFSQRVKIAILKKDLLATFIDLQTEETYRNSYCNIGDIYYEKEDLVPFGDYLAHGFNGHDVTKNQALRLYREISFFIDVKTYIDNLYNFLLMTEGKEALSWKFKHSLGLVINGICEQLNLYENLDKYMHLYLNGRLAQKVNKEHSIFGADFILEYVKQSYEKSDGENILMLKKVAKYDSKIKPNLNACVGEKYANRLI